MPKKSLIKQYNREAAVAYAHNWALKRNPNYYDFEDLGGDCTNFASQVLYAGSGLMNYTATYGWYYKSLDDRTPSWTGVEYLYSFLINNTSTGPFAECVHVNNIKPGDIIQLSFGPDKVFDHTPIVVSIGNPVKLSNILVAAHTYDRNDYKLTNYNWTDIRFIHIRGVRF